MGHITDVDPVEDAVGGMGNGLVETALGHSDGCRPDIELADVHRIKRRIPSVGAAGKDVFLGDGIVVEGEVGDVLLMGNDVLSAHRPCGGSW